MSQALEEAEEAAEAIMRGVQIRFDISIDNNFGSNVLRIARLAGITKPIRAADSMRRLIKIKYCWLIKVYKNKILQVNKG